MIHPELLQGLRWGSHIPALAACVDLSPGRPVLELGVGHFSTPLLHAMCAHRKLYSFESDTTWLSQFEYLKSLNHIFVPGDYEETLKPILAEHDRFSVAFIDNSPGGPRRETDFARTIQKTDFVIVHDYEGENEKHIAPYLGDFSHLVLARYGPPTLVVSTETPIPLCFYQLR